MIITAYGGGANSTALLIECAMRSIAIDLILFADTGGEKPHTYKYIKMFSKWCTAHGLPEITRVQQVNQHSTYITLEHLCLNKHVLPSLAYGFKSCSKKHKIAPQDKFVNNWTPAKEVWGSGQKITKFIGYDADEIRRAKDYQDKKYILQYPLIEWGINRDECIEIIKNAGLESPGKSSCFFCPASKLSEIHQLREQYPELATRALEMEANADLHSVKGSVKGLGRRFAWKDIIDDPSATTELPPELDCGCYDG